MFEFAFVPTDIFRLIDVTDHAGTSKVDSRDLYRERIGCVAQNIRQIELEHAGETFLVMWMDFVQDSQGRWINLHLRTSPVIDIKIEKDIVEIRTLNSVYVMQAATLVPNCFRSATDLIELFLTDEGDRFAKGYYYAAAGQPHELVAYTHEGLLVDTCLVHFLKEDLMCGIACRYYIDLEKVEIYNTLYGQQNYGRPILIHNNSSEPMTVEFEMFAGTWTIEPWGEKTIVPFTNANSDT